MKLLILGGTGFLGPHTVDAALAAGHSVTLFNRGKTNAGRFPDVELLIGDRDPLKGDGLASLRGRSWDAVIDICGYVPRLVGASAQLLADHVERYVFISTISVYSDLSQSVIDENSAVGSLADPTVEKITGETYGPLKVLCEQAAEAAMPGRVLNIRPGLIVGPGIPPIALPIGRCEWIAVEKCSRPEFPTTGCR
jgi:2'-hydroxyisoflavone reductase